MPVPVVHVWFVGWYFYFMYLIATNLGRLEGAGGDDVWVGQNHVYHNKKPGCFSVVLVPAFLLLPLFGAAALTHAAVQKCTPLRNAILIYQGMFFAAYVLKPGSH
ncbi:MAG: hypothetical protein COS85_23135 [Armatimonadetes bacterium CG07_land_8_20_14_0_80_59_28]|nr:MAG: hypothetical protein COS85_23135 [Armatimonadetes bacterium CG07_land_8_20_14_0_80_59_28]PIX38818.1 MAG: hypothetical protein COZ56_19425 [Armatimonadetes bacterium CG_4_8_14_3_um_filter_58_9]PIY42901.1 MAG: hypothetical protein COZ05_12670 [Armatimonadetes bacterium CG_4_10_14_3_um_filter_59_10]